MNNDSLVIKIIAALDEKLSKIRIKKDIKKIENTPFYLRLIGKLDKSKTDANVKRILKNTKKHSINIDAKINKKSLENSLKEAVNNAQSNKDFIDVYPEGLE